MHPSPIPTCLPINWSKVVHSMARCAGSGGKQTFLLLDRPSPTPPQLPDRDGPAIVTKLFPDTQCFVHHIMTILSYHHKYLVPDSYFSYSEFPASSSMHYS